MTLIKHVFVALSAIVCVHTCSRARRAHYRRNIDLGKQELIDLFKKVSSGIEVVLPEQQEDFLKKQTSNLQSRKFDNTERKFTKVKFVKRLVPHGEHSLTEEYDADKNTLFKPLFVVHQRHDLPKKYQKNLMAYIADEIQKNDAKSEDETLLQPFQYEQDTEEEMETQKKITKNSKKYAKPQKYKKQKSKTYYRDLLASFEKSLAEFAMRASFDKSGEEAPSIKNLIKKYTQNSGETPKKQKPETYYPFWNWWIYKQTVYQDECEEYQVKIGGICIKVPEH